MDCYNRKPAFFLLLLLSGTLYGDESIGVPDEADISRLFLRDSEVLLKNREFQFSIGLNYNNDERLQSFRDSRNRHLSIPLGLSYGLTNNLELNASIPLSYKSTEVIAPTNVTQQSKSGIGDLSLGLSYKLKNETASSPSITASFGTTAPTGNEANSAGSPSLGSGLWGASTSLHLSKSIDPAVVFFNLGYQHAFEDEINGIKTQPGDTFTYGFGAGLSINNSLSFSGRIAGSFQQETQQNGQTIMGTSHEPISFVTGMSYRVNSNTRLETNLNLGLSDDANDVGIGAYYIWNR